MTSAQKNLLPKSPAFEPRHSGTRWLDLRRKTTAAIDDGHRQKSSRGDKTPLELFIGGVQGWEAGVRRHFEDSKSKRP